ncbi:hypothetical protein, variant [Puccinia triticina 1-1 BBBD Race 1]|uniref:RNA polymerase II transcription factor B 38 kDa subunit n=1 Tax=Puccinia triticina (isolate 1-1 / race 1 (BBBD)) TaxID=630390 RepID=A0A180GA80_PUCT1|nr:hypothetical protein, variant [Puccinia triticina 1-1 BBBD Race 1]
MFVQCVNLTGTSIQTSGCSSQNVTTRCANRVSIGSSRWARNRVQFVDKSSERRVSHSRRSKIWPLKRKWLSVNGSLNTSDLISFCTTLTFSLLLRCSFNKRQEDFMTLDAYNNYLEEVEDITFNLINGVDVAETEAKIKQFQIENQELIAQNAVHEARQAELSKRQEEAVRKEREERKAELLRLEEEARREEEEIKRATIHSLETSNVSADKLVARQRAVAQKRATARALASDLATKATVAMPSLSGLIDPSSMEGADVNRPDIEGELGQWDDYSSMFDLKRLDANLQPGYIDHDSMRLVLADHALALVGGFEIESVWERQLRSAMMGLFVPPPEAGAINQTTSDDLSLHNLRC